MRSLWKLVLFMMSAVILLFAATLGLPFIPVAAAVVCLGLVVEVGVRLRS